MKNNEIKLKTYITSDQIQIKVKELADKINSDYFKLHSKDTPLYTICLLKGGVMFFAELIKYLKMPVKMCFVTLSSYNGNTTSSGTVKSIDINIPDLNKKNVLIVDDIIDKGYTLDYFIKYLKSNFDIHYLNFAVLLDKNTNRSIKFQNYYKAFDIDDKFVVGYGMDYKELYRNLDYIAIVEND